jgi:hypothetical protein
LPYDASSRKDIRRLEKRAERAEQERINFVIGVMSIPQGRQWFYGILERCHLFEQSPTFNAKKDYFVLGERNIGLQIYADLIRHCAKDFVKMMGEANVRTNERSAIDGDPNGSASGEHSGGAERGWNAEESSEPDLFDEGAG